MYPDAIPLSFGDMDYELDPAIARALVERLSWPLGYPPPYESSGVASVIAQYYRRCHGIELPADAFWLAAGCLTQSFHVISALVGPGDEVLYWRPGFKYVRGAITSAGAIPIPVSAEQDRELIRDDLDAAISPATRLIYLVNPHNPTGKVYTVQELQVICETAAEHSLTVVSNELHSRLVLDGTHVPFTSLSETAARLSVTLSGASKSHNLAGIGGSFAFSANADLMRAVRNRSLHNCADATSLQQAALVAAYTTDSPWLSATIERLRSSREVFCTALRAGLPRLEFSPPRATYFLWIDFGAYLEPHEDAAAVLRSHCGIVAGAGPEFGGRRSQARLSFSATEDVLDQALEQLTEGLRSRPPRRGGAH